MNFASDTTGPVHPKVFEALARANDGYQPGYGADAIMDRVRDRIRDIFEAPEAEVFLVSTGTVANALILATLIQPWEAVYASAVSHIHMDECGAPEFFAGGAKLVLVPETHGRMTPADLDAAIREGRPRGVHYVQPGAVSVTQVTECGTVHTLEDLAALGATAKTHGLPAHLDGARFANAIASLGCTPAEMTWKAGYEAVSFGGTKNGLLGVEAAILFDPSKAREFAFRQKRAGQLFSRHRFLSAQFDAVLQDDLWLDTARAANRAGRRLSDGLKALPHAQLDHPTEANMVFARLPRAAHRRAVHAGAQYYMTLEDLEGGSDEDLIPTRLVTNWATTDEEIDRFLGLVA